MTDFVADFAFNSTEKKVYSKTIEHANPAIKLTVNERSTVQATPWIFYQFPDLFEIKDSKYQFELIGYKPKKYHGSADRQEPRHQHRLDRLDDDRRGHYALVVHLPSPALDEDHPVGGWGDGACGRDDAQEPDRFSKGIPKADGKNTDIPAIGGSLSQRHGRGTTVGI